MQRRRRPLLPAAPCSPLRRLLGGLRRAPAADDGEVHGRRGVLPAAVRRRAGRRRPRRRSTNLTQPGERAARPRARRSSRPPTVAEADVVVYERRLPARRRRRRSTQSGRRGDVARRRADVATGRRTPSEPAPTTRTSGSTRCGWPTSRDAVADAAGRRSTPTTPTPTAPTPPTCAPTSSGSTRRTPTGLADCERDTVVVSHDAFGYLDAVRPGARADRRPLPRRRADARRPRPSSRT